MARNWVKSVAAGILAVSFPLSLSGCSTSDVAEAGISAFHLVTLGVLDTRPKGGTIDEGRVIGYVSADEPNAILVGEQILRNGGTAADAAAALYFSLAVTYPAAAGLGGGGACTYYDSRSNGVAALDFMPRPSGTNPETDLPIPGNVAGFGELHRLYGVLPWPQIIVRAEALAQAGFKASRAMANSFAAMPPTRRGSRMLAPLVKTAKGRPIIEGAEVTNLALARTLSALRLNGTIGFYSGALAQDIARAGRSVRTTAPTTDTLKNYFVQQRGAGFLRVGDGTIAIAGSGEGIALLTKMATNPEMLARVPRSGGVPAQANMLRELEMSERRSAGLPDKADGAKSDGTSFAVIDRAGNAVSCYVTTQGPMGSGVMVGELGFTFAAPNASREGRMAQAGTVAGLVLDGKRFRAAVGGSGGVGAAATLLSMSMPDVIDGDIALDNAMRGATTQKGARSNGIGCLSTNIANPNACTGAVSQAGHGLGRRVRF